MNVHFRIVLAVLSALVLCSPAFAQKTISGTVRDSYGDPVIGAGVIQEGTNNGTVTDLDGNFVLTVSEGTNLTVSAMGYKTIDFVVDSRTVYNFVLQDDSTLLEGAEVVAYGTQQKVSVTGSLSSIKSEDILRTPVSSINNVLAGQLSGVTTVQTSGEPGSDAATIYVRGQATWQDSSPLIQVDGVERSMADLNPEDIESITVLKDASATAVFGVRGANGVILVTTKRGAEGKATINVSTSFSVLTPTATVEQASSLDYALFYNQMRANDGASAVFSDEVIQKFRDGSDPIRFPSIQWTDYVLKKATTQQQHSISLSGGNRRARYFVSAAFFDQGGLFKEFGTDYNFGYQYQRFNYRANLDLNVTNTTKLSLNVSGMISDADKPRTGQGSSTMLRNIYYATPFSSPGLVDGKYVVTTDDYSDGLTLPFVGTDGLEYYVSNGGGFISTNINKLQMDLALEQNLDFVTKGLLFKIKGAYNSQYNVVTTGTASIASYEPVIQADGSIAYRKNGEDSPVTYSNSFSKARDWYFEASLNYGRSFGNHSVTGLVLYNQSKEYYPDTYSDVPRGYVGLVGRVTYDYKKRYLAEFNMGYNGSENFHPDRRFGFFPAGSVGWVVSDERFFQPIKKVISFFKIRASWGLVGNDKIGGTRFMYLSDPYTVENSTLTARSGYAYNFGVDNSTVHLGAYEDSRNNPNVTWEKAFKQNYGVDLYFLNERLQGSFDYYTEHRTGILLQDMTAPGIIGFDVPYANLGIVDSWGWEISLGWSDRINRDFNYWAKVNLSHNQNEIIEKKETPYSNEFQYEKGNRIGARYMYQFFEFYNENTPAHYEEVFGVPFPTQLVDVQDGDAVFVDLDGNGYIDGNDMTRTLGYTDDPEYVIGINAGFNWKNLEFNMQWTGAWGVTRMLGESFRMPFVSRTDYTTGGLLQYHVDNTWNPNNPSQDALYPRATWTNGSTNNYQDCALYEKDASYLRLKTLTIAYNLSARFLRTIGVSRAQIAFSGYNLLTFTPYIFGDPENVASSSPTYPLQRTYTLSLKLNF